MLTREKIVLRVRMPVEVESSFYSCTIGVKVNKESSQTNLRENDGCLTEM